MQTINLKFINLHTIRKIKSTTDISNILKSRNNRNKVYYVYKHQFSTIKRLSTMKAITQRNIGDRSTLELGETQMVDVIIVIKLDK